MTKNAKLSKNSILKLLRQELPHRIPSSTQDLFVECTNKFLETLGEEANAKAMTSADDQNGIYRIRAKNVYDGLEKLGMEEYVEQIKPIVESNAEAKKKKRKKRNEKKDDFTQAELQQEQQRLFDQANKKAIAEGCW